ncbi:response regulator [Tunturiibacter empetritectus]|uniref:CheY-like chemotaxis protein n=2 Tax=Tunturiibacter TaxID=3154218 RepID=A0A852VPC4_9BACT|nr:response regulator [Edaphobacter lichenicola]NYF91915.1 CheY-like chemotaxis protein [Edaphobacter lichenicola]
MTAKIKFEVVPLTVVPNEDAISISERTKPVILIVDDEHIIADTLSIILSRSGFSTLTAYDGAAALELARTFNPQLLIADVMMPGMTGIELAIAVSQNIPECQILLFSGQAATADLLVHARSAGYNFTTLTKPVHPTDMLKRVSECLAVQKTTFAPPYNPTDDSSRPATYLVN